MTPTQAIVGAIASVASIIGLIVVALRYAFDSFELERKRQDLREERARAKEQTPQP